jgi:hypothetical protein
MGERPFRIAVIEVGALICEKRRLAGYAEPVCETGRDIKLPPVVRREGRTRPFPEIGRPGPDVHSHVEDFALKNIDELRLPVRVLEMQPAKHAMARQRQIVLYEVARNSRVLVAAGVPGFLKETTIVAKPVRFDDQNAWKLRFDDLHPASRFRRSNRYCP